MIRILTEGACGIAEDRLAKVAAALFEVLGLSGEAEAELIFMTPQQIKQLNADTRNVDCVTDVLSFPTLSYVKPFSAENYPFDYDADTGCVCIGSIVICDEKAKQQAEEYGHSYEREICYLLTHGLLHLMGFDHEKEEDKTVMRKKEEEILALTGNIR